MFKYVFKFEQNRKGPWTCVRVTSLNRLDFYKFLGTGINSFGYIFNSVELFENPQKRKMKKDSVPLGQNGHSAAGTGRISPPHGRQRARQVFRPDGRGPASVRGERSEGEGRLTGGARLSSLTLRQRAGELTGDVPGHGGAS